MPAPRRSIAVVILVAVSLGLTAGWNHLAGIIHDFAANLYLTGLTALAGGLLVHLFIVRRFLQRDQLLPFCIGLALSGLLSIVLYEGLRDLTAHLTWLQREGTSISWGDDGTGSGLPRSASGLSHSDFWPRLPRTLVAAAIYGVLWFPALAFLERWAYAGRARLNIEN